MGGEKLKSRVYLTAGFIMVGLGVVGIPMPLLPTTPFLLVAAYCFARGSPRWHEWLLTHRILGAYITAFRRGRGLTAGQKWRIAALLTVTLLITALIAPYWYGRALATFIWVTALIGLFLYPSAANLPRGE
jgi:uncharacterized membrane protein YbaN (DUF454 family)